MAPHMECSRTEQIISQFLLKALHVILDSRIPSLRSVATRGGGEDKAGAAAARRRDKWFNLALGEPPAALESLNFWHRSIVDPMVIDVMLVQEAGAELAGVVDRFNAQRAVKETVVERWVIQYEQSRAGLAPVVAGGGEGGAALYKKMYKKSIILIRSLHSMLRLLPTYRVFRMLNSSSRACDFDLSYKVSSFCEPFTRAEEEEMKVQSFAPVETAYGRVSVSVTYRATLADLNLESSSSYPPQIIADYVGSPAAEPLKVFPSANDRSARGGASYSQRGYRSPSSSPFDRPHSWSSGIHQPGPAANYTYSASPPPYFTPPPPEYQNSPPDIGGHRLSNYRPMVHKKAMSFDDHRLSPPFSLSPSPSPSAHLSPSNSPLQARLRSESTPVNIPLPMMGKGYRYLSPNLSDPNKQFLPPPSPRSSKGETSSGSPSGSRSFRKLEGLRGVEHYSGSPNFPGYIGQKVKDSKDDSGRFSGVVSSSGSPRIGFSRSSSRLSFQDDLDDSEFSCPFAVDDVDSADTYNRTTDGKEAPESSSNHALPSSRTSQDAAVGILVHMLRTAPPLRQDQSYMSQSSKSEFDGQVGSSSFFMPRKTSDALEELRSYKEMKDQLLSQSAAQLLGSFKQRTNNFSG